jgi:hypothetical protein
MYNYCWLSLAQSFSGPSPAGPTTIFYSLRFGSPRTWSTRSQYLYSPGIRWSSYTPGTGFLLRLLLRLTGERWRYSNPGETDLQLNGYPQVFINSVTTSEGSALLSKEQTPLGSVYIPWRVFQRSSNVFGIDRTLRWSSKLNTFLGVQSWKPGRKEFCYRRRSAPTIFLVNERKLYCRNRQTSGRVAARHNLQKGFLEKGN